MRSSVVGDKRSKDGVGRDGARSGGKCKGMSLPWGKEGKRGLARREDGPSSIRQIKVRSGSGGARKRRQRGKPVEESLVFDEETVAEFVVGGEEVGEATGGAARRRQRKRRRSREVASNGLFGVDEVEEGAEKVVAEDVVLGDPRNGTLEKKTSRGGRG